MASILNWAGKTIRPSTQGFWAWWSGADNTSGQVVNERTVLSLAAAWACTRLISETISTLPLKVYERVAGGQREAQGFPLYSMLTSVPNKTTTATVHWEATIASMLLRGAAWWERLEVSGRLVGMQYLAPLYLRIDNLGRGRFRFYYRDPVTDIEREIPQKRMVYIPGFSLDGQTGVSVISYGANVFGNALAANAAASKTFNHGLLPTTYLKTERVLNEKQRDTMRGFVDKVSGSLHAGKPFVLEAGMTVGNVGIDPKDAQLLESRGYSAAEVCSIFRVPPWMVGVATGEQTKWGSGLEQELIAFLTFTLRPWLKRVEQSVEKEFLTPAERLKYFVKYDVQELLLADSQARAKFYQAMIAAGVMKPSEARVREHLPDVGGNSDALWIQGAMKLMDSPGVPLVDGGAQAYAKMASDIAELLRGSTGHEE